MLLTGSLLASDPPPPKATCLYANGKTACGYDCRASVTEVGCAST